MNSLALYLCSFSSIYLLYVFLSSVILSFEYHPSRVDGLVAFFLYLFSFTTNNFLVIKTSLLLLSIPYILYGLCIFFAKQRFSPLSVLPLAVFFSWFVGFYLALTHSIPIQDALSNFNFLLLSPIAYCSFLFAPETILLSSCAACFLLLVLFFASFSSSIFLITFVFYLNSIYIAWLPLFTTLSRAPLSTAFLYLFPRKLSFLKNVLFSRFFSFVVVLACLPLIFAYVSTTSFLIMVLFVTLVLRIKLFPLKLFQFIFSLALLILALLFVLDVFPFIHNLIFFEIESDVRITKFSSIVSDIKLFGNGLGSTFDSIAGRGKDYGFELIYLNLIHKLGIFAFPILSVYTIVALKAAKNLFVYYRSLSLSSALFSSSVVFLITGLFNPTLGSFYASLFLFLSYSNLTYLAHR